MPRIHRLVPVLALVLVAASANAQTVRVPRSSPAATVMQTVGVTDVTVSYARPAVNNRAIWGGLVPYDKLWRLGANEATKFTTADDVTINGQTLKAGSYGMAAIPGEKSWILIFNKRDDMWGTNGYKQEEDALRVTVTPQAAPHAERLTTTFENVSETGADLVFHWEKVRVAVRVETATRDLTLAKARAAMPWNAPMAAANYCLQNNTNLEEAMKWIDISTMYDRNYWNLRVKAQLLEKTGKRAEAVTVMEEAVAKGTQMANAPFDFDAMKKLLADWKKK